MAKIKSYHDTVYDSETGVPVVFTKEEYATRQGRFYHAHIDTGALGDGDSAELYFKITSLIDYLLHDLRRKL